MRHPRWTEFSRLLQQYAIRKRFRTKTELADHLGVKQEQLHKWIARGVMPSAANLQTIAKKARNKRFTHFRSTK